MSGALRRKWIRRRRIDCGCDAMISDAQASTDRRLPRRLTAASLSLLLQILRDSGAVRFDSQEAETLVAALDGIPADALDIFGSRVGTGSLGGDIDILRFTAAAPLETARHVSIRFFSRCEEKLAVIVIDERRVTLAQLYDLVFSEAAPEFKRLQDAVDARLTS